MLDIQTLAFGYLLLCVAGGAASVSLLWAAGPPCPHLRAAARQAPMYRRMALAAVVLVALVL